MGVTTLTLGSVSLQAQIPYSVIERNPGVLIQGRGEFIEVPGKRSFKIWNVTVKISSDADRNSIKNLADGQPQNFTDGFHTFNNGSVNGKVVIMNDSLDFETRLNQYSTRLLLFEYDQT